MQGRGKGEGRGRGKEGGRKGEGEGRGNGGGGRKGEWRGGGGGRRAAIDSEGGRQGVLLGAHQSMTDSLPALEPESNKHALGTNSAPMRLGTCQGSSVNRIKRI